MRAVKWIGDRVAAALLLLLLSPLLAAIAVWILVDGGRPAILAQERAGKNGRTFRMLKYRTMVQNALELAPQVTDDPFGVIENDPRVTRPGRFLRRTGLDELPQLWNVLRGEMSLVGPRPFVIHESEQITGWASRRLETTPGITGLWQVLGRNDIPFEEMVKLDYVYVTNWSLWWDIKILVQTLPTVLKRQGAY
jgi:lipopolysaccharide/colanic/teichoic acid biosynthesis glycosyltransferase